MRILFCHENFPDRFGYMASLLAANPENEVLFASCFQRKGTVLPKVRRIILKTGDARRLPPADNYAGMWARAVQIGMRQFDFLQKLNADFHPDLVFSSASNGVGFFLHAALPQSFKVFYVGRLGSHDQAQKLKANLDMQLPQILASDLCFAFSEQERSLFPPALRESIRLQKSWLDTDFFSPLSVPASSVHLVSFDVQNVASQNLRKVCQVLFGLLSKRTDCRLAILFGANPLAEKIRAWLATLPDSMRQRTQTANFLRLQEYLDLFRTSRLYICQEAGPSPCPGWLEAMSCATAVMLPESLKENPFPQKNTLNFPENDPAQELAAVLQALDKPKLLSALGMVARKSVLEMYGQDRIVPPHLDFVLNHAMQKIL